MNHEAPTPGERDRARRRAGRLRRTLVGGSAAASLGIAATLGLGALGHPTAPGSTTSSGTSGLSSGTADRSSPTQSTQSAQSNEPNQSSQTPHLSSGSGSSHATTSGA